MEVFALDKDYRLIAVAIPYTNLQWNRRYYDFGDFTMEVTLSSYDPNWAFIGTSERPELGMIQKVRKSGDDDIRVTVSGFFCEKMLDDKTVYPRFKGSATHLENLIRRIYEQYKDDLPIELSPANDPAIGDEYQADFSDDNLGTKFYKMCEKSEISLRVTFDYKTEKLHLGLWEGKDRTHSQRSNSYQTFSMEFGNIQTRDVNIDVSNYKNYAIIPCDGDDNNIEQDVLYLDLSNGGYKKEIVIDLRSDKLEEDENYNDFKERVLNKAFDTMLTYQVVEEMDITTAQNAGYLVDYDLGDKCDVILTDLGISAEARIVEVLEVFKAQGHTVTLGFGNKRLTDFERARQ